jgi:hypothetical protein
MVDTWYRIQKKSVFTGKCGIASLCTCSGFMHVNSTLSKWVSDCKNFLELLGCTVRTAVKFFLVLSRTDKHKGLFYGTDKYKVLSALLHNSLSLTRLLDIFDVCTVHFD